jgi:hypothetical protein
VNSVVQSPLEALVAPTPDDQSSTVLSEIESASASLFSLDSMKLKRAQLQSVCEGLGKPRRAQLVAPYQSGAQLHEAFQTEGDEIALRMFLEWWLYEDAADRLQAFMLGEFGSKAQLLERSTAQNFRYRIQLADPGDASASQVAGSGEAPAANMQSALSDIFAKFESQKVALSILEYSVGQTTLEQIFNQFASQQDNPEVQAANASAVAATTSSA